MYRYKLYRCVQRCWRRNPEKVVGVEGILRLKFAEEKKNLISMSVQIAYQPIIPESYPAKNLGNAYGVIDQGKPKMWCLVCFPKAKQMNMYNVKSRTHTHFHGLIKEYDMGCSILLQTKNFFECIDLDSYQPTPNINDDTAYFYTAVGHFLKHSF